MTDEATWQKSSFSQGAGECIEISGGAEKILIRESDSPETIVATGPEGLGVLILTIKAGEFGHLL
ncbi:DUF397 domain-containing protein [Streptomyces sp. NPDC050509]